MLAGRFNCIRLYVGLVVSAVLLQGCDLQGFSLLNGTEGFFGEADKRVFVSKTNGDKKIFCAEPSPDVHVSRDKDTDGSLNVATHRVNVGASFSHSLAETALELGVRSMTVQVLRDGMYRACEALANGVIDEFAYGMILAKYENTLLQLVAIEALKDQYMTPTDAGHKKALSDEQKAIIDLASAKATEQEKHNNVSLLKKEHETKEKEKRSAKEHMTKINNELALVMGKIPGAKGDEKDRLEGQKNKLEQLYAQAKAESDKLDQPLKDALAALVAGKQAYHLAQAETKTKAAALAGAKVEADGVRRALRKDSSAAVIQILSDERITGTGNTMAVGCMNWLAKNEKAEKPKGAESPMVRFCTQILNKAS